jgi:hypothetical protein
MPDIDPRVRVIYDESVRGLDMQSDWLDELRQRTGVLIAAATVTAALLGASALEHHDAKYSLNVLGFMAFAATIALCIGVLWPTPDWEFNYQADHLNEWYQEEELDPTEMCREMAINNAESRANNKGMLKGRYKLFRFACGALAADVIFWLLAVGVR